MKYLFPIIVLGTIGYVGYVFWQNQKPGAATEMSDAPVKEAPVGQEAPAVQAVAIDSPTPAVVAAAPGPQRTLAPGGIYYLTQRIPVTTDSGVIGDPPGTKVTVVSTGPTIRVTDGQNQFEVQPGQITNDPGVAARLYYSDRAAQSLDSSERAAAAQQLQEQQEASQKAWTAQQMARPPVYSGPLPMSVGELNQGAAPVKQPDGYTADGTPWYKSTIH
jgi:hypothetical protein